MVQRKTKETFILEAQHKHGAKYGYPGDYCGGHVLMLMECPMHGVFRQRPSSHLRGAGCPTCGIKKAAESKRYTIDEFIVTAKEKHGDKYQYPEKCPSLSEKMLIICPIHGVFKQMPTKHLQGQGCPGCVGVKISKSKTYSHEEFEKLARAEHGERYIYLSEYVGCFEPMCIRCVQHGEFWQQPSDHLGGSGCPSCQNSKGEKIILDVLGSIGLECVTQHKFQNCKSKRPLRFDVWIPGKKVAIEYDGEAHFVDSSWYDNSKCGHRYQDWVDLNKRDKIKDVYCAKNGIRLIRIPYWDRDNIAEILMHKLKK